MTVEIIPGPVPADGTRINANNVLTSFVQGTRLTNFGPANFVNSQGINFLVSATNAPETSTRSAGMLWFRRGEGVLYFWDAKQAGESIALWVATSNRKECVVRVQSGPASLGSVLWMDSGAGQGQFTEFHGVQVGANRMVIKTCATDMDDTNIELRSHPVPPYFVCCSDVALTFSVTSFSGVGDGVFQTAVELGYYPAKVVGLDASEGPGHGILQASNPSDVWFLSQNPYTESNSYGAIVVGSGPPAANGTLLVFLRANPASLCF